MERVSGLEEAVKSTSCAVKVLLSSLRGLLCLEDPLGPFRWYPSHYHSLGFTEHQWPSTRTQPEVLQHLHLQWRQKQHISLDSVNILDCKVDEDRRGIRKSECICMLHLDLNKDGGR